MFYEERNNQVTQDDRFKILEDEVEKLRNMVKRLSAPKETVMLTGIPQTSLNSEFEAIVGQIKAMRGLIATDYPRDVAEIEFLNRDRFQVLGLLKEIPDGEEDKLAFIGRIYENRYRACIAEADNRKMRIKLTARDSFNAALEVEKEKRIEKEVEKEKRHAKQFAKENNPKVYERLTAEEKALKTLMGPPFNMSKEDALSHLKNLKKVG